MQNKLEITILIENSSSNPEMLTEHGIAYLIKYGDQKIIFDCGQSNKLIKNSETLGLDLTDLDAIAFSHGHYDHTGGLPFVFTISPDATVYLHPDAFKSRFSKKQGEVTFIGMSRRSKRYINGMDVHLTPKTTEITPGLSVTGVIPRMTDFETTGGDFFLNVQCTRVDKILDDQSMFIETSKGLVVVLGCCHSGVINTLNYIDRISDNQKIHAVIGGMHLLNADEARIKRTINIFKRRGIEVIIPLHCTGGPAVEALKENLPENTQIFGAGDTITFE